MPTLFFQTALRRRLGLSEFAISSPPCTVLQLLDQFEKMTGLSVLNDILEAENTMHMGVMILLNGKNIRLLDGLETMAQPDDTVIVFPPSGGG